MNRRENFTAYEVMPEDLAIYMSHNGPHFNKAACQFACSQMYKVENGEEKPINTIDKETFNKLLLKYKITIKNNILYDGVYVANMCMADYFGSSIRTEEGVIKYVRDTLDDPDALEGLTFNRWIADMKWLGIPIPWDEFL